MGSSTPSAQVFLAEREAHAVQEVLRRYLDDQSMTPSQIEDLIRKGGLKTRLSLKYLTEGDLCDPIKGILQPDFIPRMPVRFIIKEIPEYLRTSRVLMVVSTRARSGGATMCFDMA